VRDLGGAQIVVVGDGPLAAAVAAALPDAASVVAASPAPRDDATPAFVEGRTFDLLLSADLVIDASGDAATRYLANDAAAVRGIPIVWADAAAGEAGAGFDEHGVDYRDAHAPDAPATGTPAPDGALAAAAAGLAAAVIADPDAAGRVLRWDGAAFTEHRVTRNADAPRPGSLEERTTIPEPDESSSITAPQLAKLLAGSTTLGVHEPVPVLLDVRDAPEVSFVTLPDAVHIPLAQLPERLDELDPATPYVVYCHHGVRSSRALGMLQRAGFTRVRHLTGGIDAYAVQVDPELPRY
jgi:sulfur-carrier protein adenylyltransferase/sulfurtransferase